MNNSQRSTGEGGEAEGLEGLGLMSAVEIPEQTGGGGRGITEEPKLTENTENG